ncbi:hypothetical protein [Aureimonas sp. N4]|uniref:hypothetical protein n=1 Tax=Aureimonas sp. N4 TaxID=1638165 RepID=UPI0007826356|nr:hypothetical protein [Aureimonas sp. N4]
MQTKTNPGEAMPPPLPPTAPGRPAKDRYREQYGIVLVCPNEEDQAKLYEAFEALRSCKIKVVVT